MSYDLYLYRTEDAPPLTVAEADRVILPLPHAKKLGSADYPQYSLINEETDEGFLIDFEDEGMEEGDEQYEEEDECYGFEHTGPFLIVNISYGASNEASIRSLGVVAMIAKGLNLRVYDPQGEQDLEPAQLVESWNTNYAMARKVLNELVEGHSGLVHADPALMAYYESYTSHKPEIESEWADVDIYLPEIMLLKPAGEDKIVRAVVWPECIRMIFPEVEYVWISRKKRRFLRLLSAEEQGLIEFSDALSILGEDLERVEQPVVHYICKREKARPEVVQAVGAMELIPHEVYTLIDLKNIVTE